MTTIAFDGSTLACDGRATSEDMIIGDSFNKILRAGPFLVGFAGDMGAELLIRRFVTRDDFKASDGLAAKFRAFDTVFLVIDAGSSVKFFSSENLLPVERKAPCAIGSGAMAAEGALLAGATAEEAVHIASQLDPFTGGLVRAISVSKGE